MTEPSPASCSPFFPADADQGRARQTSNHQPPTTRSSQQHRQHRQAASSPPGVDCPRQDSLIDLRLETASPRPPHPLQPSLAPSSSAQQKKRSSQFHLSTQIHRCPGAALSRSLDIPLHQGDFTSTTTLRSPAAGYTRHTRLR